MWNHENVRERKLFVEPDSHCRIRDVDGDIPNELVKKAEARWGTAARAHYNLDLRFNSQSLIVAMTQQPCIGGRAWPNCYFQQSSVRIRVRTMEQFHTRIVMPLVDVQQISGWPWCFNDNKHSDVRYAGSTKTDLYAVRSG